MTSGNASGINHRKVVGALTVAQRDALLGKANFSRDIPAKNTPSHQQASVPHYFINQSGEEVPKFGCVQVTGTEESNGQNYLIGKKPADSTGAAGWYVFNGACAVPDGEKGVCYDGVLVRAKTDGTFEAGESVSPQAGSFAVGAGSLFPVAGPDDITDDCHKIFILGGGAGETIIFSINGPSGVEEAIDNHCENKLEDAESSYEANVVWRPCGVSRVKDETADGTVIVHDSLQSFLYGREASEVAGRLGVAVYLQEDGGYECQWVITFMDWWREIQVLSDVLVLEDEIRFEVKRVKVWDDCDLDDIVIPLIDCEDES